MNTLNPSFILVILILLILVSAFFSGSETAMMSLNRYRLRHLSRKGHQRAKRASQLLERPDRLLGVILIGNTFANILASSLATMLAVHYFHDLGIAIVTVVLTLVILILGETAPKTLAALYPEKMAFSVVFLLQILLKLFYPLVWLVNGVANGCLSLLGAQVKHRHVDPLSAEELRSLVHDASGKISSHYQTMLLRILDLEHMSLEDVMVVRNEVIGIDLEAPWETILQQITKANHQYLPVYRNTLDRVEGVLDMHVLLLMMQKTPVTLERLQQLAEPVYFVPEGASLGQQLFNFQTQKKSVALVVDEYGDIQGLVTLQDILEEIVGEFTTDVHGIDQQIQRQRDGSIKVAGSIAVRDLNRLMNWSLPLEGPKTLSGLLIEYLEIIPTAGIACRIAGYPMEILAVSDNTIDWVCIWPELYQHAKSERV